MGQPGEAFAWSRWKQLALIFTRIALSDLERRLILEAIEGVRLDSPNS
jgi:hypothetical protein